MIRTKRNAVRAVLLWCAVTVCALTGCSVYRASHQPGLKDMSVLTPGTSRDRVVAEFGAPIDSEPDGQGKKEIYTFVQGYSETAKTGRALFHGAADILTIGLWEAVGTPLEGAFDGKKISVSVVYDKNEKVESSKTLSVTDP
jgi:hypothetical protein